MQIRTGIDEMTRLKAEAEARATALARDLEAAESRAARPAEQPASSDHDATADLRRENATLREELDSMGMRLRRAYADAEDARAQLAAGPPTPVAVSLADVGGPSSADGIEEDPEAPPGARARG